MISGVQKKILLTQDENGNLKMDDEMGKLFMEDIFAQYTYKLVRERDGLTNQSKDIKWIEALGDYVKVVTEENSLVVLSTMKAFDKELPEGKFLRIHKSYIVNLDKIDRFNSKNVEVGAYEIPLSRNKKTQLVDALNNM